MARRISFEVAAEDLPAAEASRAPALSGMARSLQAAAAATVREIPVDQIDASGLRDRLELNDEDIEDLAASIQSQGQLIPILVSPSPNGRYRIVYGRRRLEALRRLGIPAKALVRDLNDTQAILAQGQENSFRKDLSWIEKASFARELLDSGRSDELVCDALNIDQKARRSGEKLTGLSRMRQVTTRFAPALIEAVGPAPSVGRDRWYDLSVKIERKGILPTQQDHLIESITQAREKADSDKRFNLLEQLVNRQDEAPAAAEKIAVQNYSSDVGEVKTSTKSASITISARKSKALHAWVCENPQAALEALMQAYQAQSDQPERSEG